MTLRLQSAPRALSDALELFRAPATIARPANDNVAGLDAMLNAALRHFARHGLAAAHHARLQAETALHSGDAEGYKWWLEICRMLNRRMASAIELRSASGAQRRP